MAQELAERLRIRIRVCLQAYRNPMKMCPALAAGARYCNYKRHFSAACQAVGKVESRNPAPFAIQSDLKISNSETYSHYSCFSPFETPGPIGSRIGTAKHNQTRELANGPNWHAPCIRNHGEECSRLLTPQHYKFAVEEAVFNIGREYPQNFQSKQTLSKRRGRSLA
jgi:hypothetical protein